MAIFGKFKTVMRRLTGGNECSTVAPVDQGLQQALGLIEEGNMQEDAGQLEQARALYEKAVQIAPTLAKTHLNLGNVLLALDQPAVAVEAYSAALELKPDWAAAHFNIGNALVAVNRPKDALDAYDRAIALNSSFVDALVAKGNVQGDLKDLESAVISYQKALELHPKYAEVQLNLGNAFRALGRLDESVHCFSQVLTLTPDSPELHHSLGLAYKGLDRLTDAVASFTKAVTLKPSYAPAQIDLANTFRELGEIKKALEAARLAVEINPNDSGAWSLLFFCLSNSEDIDRETLFAEHRRFGEHFEPQIIMNRVQHSNLRDPDRVLQVGIVSGDLRNHAVTSFFEPVLLLLLRMSEISIHVYDTSGLEDDISRRLKEQVKHWNDVEILSPDMLAKLVRQDQIDVLIDLSGHTPANRLLTFARRPAPIQMSWIGYPGTTGLKSIDYYVGDRHFLPIGKYDDFFTEKILRIPANAPFQPFPYAPEVNPLPALRNGYLTFGSFNRIDKIGRNVIKLWSRLLNSLPNSRMIIAGMPKGERPQQLISWFSEEGVATNRLDFHPRSSMAGYLQMHHQVDICLDTFPYGGGTTTCHALWMGVPTLTFVGTTPSAGVGWAILSHVDLQTVFGAKDPMDFVEKGIWCAENLDYLQQLRIALRERFQNSALSQPSAVAGGLEIAIRHAWRMWCDNLPAISFEVSYENGQFSLNDGQPQSV